MGQDLIDFAEVIVAGNGHKPDIGPFQLFRGDTRPFPHALQNQLLKQRLLRLRIGPQALVLRLGHDRRIETHVALPLDEVVELVFVGNLHRLSVLKRNKRTVLLFGDRNDGLARQIAAEDKHVHAVELGAVDEFLEADVRAVEVGGEEHLHLPVCVLVLLAPEHDGTLGSELGQILVDFPLRD